MAIEMGQRSIEKPSSPSCLGRCTVHTLPVVGSIVVVAEVAFSLYDFLAPEGSNVLGGIHVALAVMSGSLAAGFWRYYFKAEWNQQTNSFEEQLEAQQITQRALREDQNKLAKQIEELKAVNVQLTVQNTTLEQKNTELVAKEELLLVQLGSALAQLKDFPDLVASIEGVVKNVQKEHSAQEGGKVLGKKVALMEQLLEALEKIPKKISERDHFAEIKEIIDKLILELEATEAESMRFNEQLQVLKREREEFAAQVETQRQILEQFSQRRRRQKKRDPLS